MPAKPQIVTCPTCNKPVAWVPEQQFKPFCSQRCKLIDLGDWATEAHKIPGEPAFQAEDGAVENPNEWL